MIKKQIETFIKKNPTSTYKIGTKSVQIINPWGDDTLKLVISKNNDFSKLENIVLPEDLIAIYHINDELLEFIYAPSDPNEEILKRKFELNFEGKTYKCYFDESTDILELLAKSYKPEKPAEKSGHRNLNEFSDYYLQTNLPKFLKDYYKDTKPYSFFIKGKLKLLKGNYTKLLKNINFYFSYYDRESPLIVLLNKDKTQRKYSIPCYSENEEFPEIINARTIDPTILEILNIAHKTEDIRLQFMFYYQVLEYCSYYFMENNIQKNIFRILRKPDINFKASEYTKTIIEELHEHVLKNRDDSKKMEKTILYYCKIEDVIYELNENSDFFAEDLEFDGGLKIPKLINDKSQITSLNENNIITLRNNLEKIRNVLAHLRESRENKVVLPTEKNNSLLIPYLGIIRRLAEKVAIQYE